MLKILQYRMRNRDQLMATRKNCSENVTEKERYDYIVERINEHLNIIQ